MTTIAYIANEFPSVLEPQAIDQIAELRRRGLRVICYSGTRVSPSALSLAERAFWKETHCLRPLADDELIGAVRRLASDRQSLGQLLRLLVDAGGRSPAHRIRALGYTVLGAALARQLEPLEVAHIHAHSGDLAGWTALGAARLLEISFSFTLHDSDLSRHPDLLSAKLRACQFCVTGSDYHRQHILRKYRSTPLEKVIVQPPGIDRVLPWPTPDAPPGRRFTLLSVSPLQRVNDTRFLIEACACLRDQAVDFLCWIVGQGPEHLALEKQIVALGLQGRVYLMGQVPPNDLAGYYRHADLVVRTGESGDIPAVLLEAMAHQKLVLAPAIAGISELVEHQRTGFLYQPGSVAAFVHAVHWIQANQSSVAGIARAAASHVAASYNRQRNLRAFAEQFLARIPQLEGEHAHPVLQRAGLFR
ncbi:MAG: glycosyltransferase [Terriglobales bacterium]|jgi:glycosyltransferase involved in cell wall biosynthesis